MMRYYFLIILFLPVLLHTQQGEIILYDTDIEMENSTTQTEKLKETKLKKKSKYEKAKKPKEQLRGQFINQDKHLESINSLFKELLDKMNNAIETKIKEEINRHSKNKIKYEDKLKEKLDRLVNNFKSNIDSLIKNERNYEKTKTIKRKQRENISIVSIRIGNDDPKQKIANNNLPIVVTVLSPEKIKKGILKVYAKNIKSSKQYLIYKLDPFSMNKRWAQDQNIWDGKYFNKNENTLLAEGKYQIFCSLETMNRKLVRFWGKGNKNYYVSVIKKK